MSGGARSVAWEMSSGGYSRRSTGGTPNAGQEAERM